MKVGLSWAWRFRSTDKPTREFVIDGGTPIPPGSILFQIRPDGIKEILGVFT